MVGVAVPGTTEGRSPRLKGHATIRHLERVSVSSPSSQPTPNALVLVNLAAAPSAGQTPSLPLPSPKIPKFQVQGPSLRSSPAACNCNQTCPSAAAVAGRTTKRGTTAADRACRPVTSISHRSSALGSPTPPPAAAAAAAVLTCRGCPCPAQACPPVGAAHWVCAPGSGRRYALLHPAARCTAAACLPCWLAGLVAFTAGVPPGCCAVDPSIMRSPDWPIDGVICAGMLAGLPK